MCRISSETGVRLGAKNGKFEPQKSCPSESEEVLAAQPILFHLDIGLERNKKQSKAKQAG